MSIEAEQRKKLGIIVGTGFENAFGAETEQETVDTPYGTVHLQTVRWAGGEVVLLHRHGAGHTVPPHRICHHANLWALHQRGVLDVLSTSAVGSLRADRRPGDLLILSDFVDFRGAGVTTFHEGEGGDVRHTDFSEPLNQHLRDIVFEEGMALRLETGGAIAIHPDGVYLCVSGPRYETPAEVKLFGSWHCDVVGMTVAPEAILAREIGIRYAAVSIVTNLGTGLSDSPLSHQDVTAQMEVSRPFLIQMFRRTAEKLFSLGDRP